MDGNKLYHSSVNPLFIQLNTQKFKDLVDYNIF